MRDITKQRIFFLDDEIQVCKAVSETLEEAGFEVSHFTFAEDCLEKLRSQGCDLLITDLKMPKMDGMAVLAKAKRVAPWMPVIIVTGYGDIPTAVGAIQAGAADFIEKPLHTELLTRKIDSVLQESRSGGLHAAKPLTKAEMKVLKLVLDGRSNRQIAALLRRSTRTVEAHRAHLMEKLGVKSLIDLVKRATAMPSVELPAKKKRGRDTRGAGERPTNGI